MLSKIHKSLSSSIELRRNPTPTFARKYTSPYQEQENRTYENRKRAAKLWKTIAGYQD